MHKYISTYTCYIQKNEWAEQVAINDVQLQRNGTFDQIPWQDSKRLKLYSLEINLHFSKKDDHVICPTREPTQIIYLFRVT